MFCNFCLFYQQAPVCNFLPLIFSSSFDIIVFLAEIFIYFELQTFQFCCCCYNLFNRHRSYTFNCSFFYTIQLQVKIVTCKHFMFRNKAENVNGLFTLIHCMHVFWQFGGLKGLPKRFIQYKFKIYRRQFTLIQPGFDRNYVVTLYNYIILQK